MLPNPTNNLQCIHFAFDPLILIISLTRFFYFQSPETLGPITLQVSGAGAQFY